MTDFLKCLAEAVARGDLTQTEADRHGRIYTDLTDWYGRESADGPAQARAASDTASAAAREAIETKRRMLLQAATIVRLDETVRTGTNIREQPAPAYSVITTIVRDPATVRPNLETRKATIQSLLFARMADVLHTFRPTVTGGRRNSAQMDNVVREIFGQDTGDAAAKQYARAWSEAAEEARRMFNEAGGAIPKRADWGLPQVHDAVAIRKAGFDRWFADIQPLLDLERMVDFETGLPITPSRLPDVMREVYQTIITDGWSKREPSQVGQGRGLARRHQDHRWMVFRDADGWMGYQKQYGFADPFAVMTSHIESMARDIAQMQVLGPNPRAALEYMIQAAQKANVDRGAPPDDGRRWLNVSRDAFEVFAGTTNAPEGGRVIPAVMAGIRDVITSARLTKATLSATTDFTNAALTARFNGLDATRLMQRYFALLNPSNPADRIRATRNAIIAENWIDTATGYARLSWDATAKSITRRLPITTFNVTGLSPHTQAMRQAFGMEFLGSLSDAAGAGWSRLPTPLREALERYGFSSETWDRIRGIGLDENHFLDWQRLSEADATRVLDMINTEVELAVPTTSLLGRTLVMGRSRPGSIRRELLSSALMFKSWPIAFSMGHMRRAFAEQATRTGWGRWHYLSSVAVSMTLAGALSIQLKQIAAGKDPMAMDGWGFWGAAVAQGGGLGIFGDFFLADQNRFGGGFGQTLAGPAAEFAGDVIGLGQSAVQAPFDGGAGLGRNLSNFVRNYTPVASTWWAGQAWQHMILDRLDELVNPRAAQRWKAMETRAMNETGQRYWWRPGQTLPERGPDLGAAVGER